MSNELVVLDNQAALAKGGLGLNFGNPLFQLKPATININQANTQAEGAIKGHLRINETGDQFKEMQVALLLQPVEKRSYYVGEPGQLNRSADNLMCFCSNVIRDEYNPMRELSGPDVKAKVAQAVKCQGCAKASWQKYRDDPRPKAAKRELIPPCETYYYALFVDTVYRMPLQMFIRSKSKDPFKYGMQNLSRTFMKLASQGKNPSIFDIKFKLSTKAVQDGKQTNYVLNLTDFEPITEEERPEFGNLYLQYANRGNTENAPAEETESEKIDAVSQSIDSQVVEGEYVGAEEIAI